MLTDPEVEARKMSEQSDLAISGFRLTSSVASVSLRWSSAPRDRPDVSTGMYGAARIKQRADHFGSRAIISGVRPKPSEAFTSA